MLSWAFRPVGLTCQVSINRKIPPYIGGAVLLAAASARQQTGNGRPGSTKVILDGWIKVQIVLRQRYFVVTASTGLTVFPSTR